MTARRRRAHDDGRPGRALPAPGRPGHGSVAERPGRARGLAGTPSPSSAVVVWVVGMLDDRRRAGAGYAVWASHWSDAPVRGYARSHAFETAMLWSVAAGPALVAVSLIALVADLVLPWDVLGRVAGAAVLFVLGQVVLRWVVWAWTGPRSTSRTVTRLATGLLSDVLVLAVAIAVEVAARRAGW